MGRYQRWCVVLLLDLSQTGMIAPDLRCIKTFPICSLLEPAPLVFRGSHDAKKGPILDADAGARERGRSPISAKGNAQGQVSRPR
jgi:hypothetical protein